MCFRPPALKFNQQIYFRWILKNYKSSSEWLLPWRVYISKIKKNTPPQMFFWKFSRIFQNIYSVKHFGMTASLIRKVPLNDSYFFILDTSVFSEYFHLVRIALKLLAITREKILWWKLQRLVLFLPLLKNSFFVCWAAMIETTVDVISKSVKFNIILMKKAFQNKLSRFNIPQFFNKIRFLKQWHRQT